jgi:hypothetical protein
MPEPLNYATPGLYIQPRDRVVTVATSLQITLACFLCVLACCSWAAFPVGSPAVAIFELLETLGYGIASTFALAGSLSRFGERRRWLYRVYVIAFPVIVGATVIGVALPGGNAPTAILIFAVVYTVASLVANPALIVIAWRWRKRPSENIASALSIKLVDVRPGEKRLAVLDVEGSDNEATLEEIAQAVREQRERG